MLSLPTLKSDIFVFKQTTDKRVLLQFFY